MILLATFFTLAALVMFLAAGGFSLAGDPEPPARATDGSGNPGSTMSLPTWSRILPADDGDASGCNSSRFKCVMNNQAVLDMETGLVWPRSNEVISVSWHSALYVCMNMGVGDRHGWRLPSQVEVMSLYPLPSGNPFHFEDSTQYVWTKTLLPNLADHARTVRFTHNAPFGYQLTSDLASVICVRGGQGLDLNE